MNSFSNIVGRKQAPEANLDTTTDFVRKMEPRTLTAKFAAKAGDAGEDERGITDLLIQGLIDRLPKPDSVWSLEERAKWLRTADSIFGLVYKVADNDHREINIALAEQEATASPVRTVMEKGRATQGPG